jgi:hypothetical protein
MNKILNSRPAFGHDHFIYRTPPWLAAMYAALCVLIAGLLVVLTLSVDSIPLPLTVIMWLAVGIAVFIALRRRTEEASIYFVCDREGIYFPASRARSIVARAKNVPWLHVPWHNISDIRVQLFLDETANTRGVMFFIVATESEEREFLARHAILKDPGVQKSIPGRVLLVGFSNFFFRYGEVMSILQHFQTSARANSLAPDGKEIQIDLAG